MNNYCFPAEWEKHRATWLAWPHNAEDWLGDLEPVFKSYAKLIAELRAVETVELIVQDFDRAAEELTRCGVEFGESSSFKNLNLHQIKTDRSWLRDSLPTAVRDKATGEISWQSWKFNAWAKYPNYSFDELVPEQVAKLSGLSLNQALRLDQKTPFVLEGGAIETNGSGTLLVTEECLLSSVQQRNADCSREEYEELFFKYLGISKTIWLHSGIPGDDTHGHIDDLARFVSSDAALLVHDERNPSFSEVSRENLKRLKSAKNSQGESLEIMLLPTPKPLESEGQPLPASYANFYIANEKVIVPVFKDKADDIALRIIDDCFSSRDTVPIDCRHFVVGLGTIHCSTQQEPV